jgi:predicted small lipoprotein YifL
MPRSMLFRLSLIAAVCTVLAAGGCGKKGPLYLPDQPPPAKQGNAR